MSLIDLAICRCIGIIVTVVEIGIVVLLLVVVLIFYYCH